MLGVNVPLHFGSKIKLGKWKYPFSANEYQFYWTITNMKVLAGWSWNYFPLHAFIKEIFSHGIKCHGLFLDSV